jgi:hypothetical protein
LETSIPLCFRLHRGSPEIGVLLQARYTSVLLFRRLPRTWRLLQTHCLHEDGDLFLTSLCNNIYCNGIFSTVANLPIGFVRCEPEEQLKSSPPVPCGRRSESQKSRMTSTSYSSSQYHYCCLRTGFHRHPSCVTLPTPQKHFW